MTSSDRVPRPRFGAPIGPWRTVFAWLPVEAFDGTRIWLRKVARRRIQKHDYLSGGGDSWWQYALLEDLATGSVGRPDADA